MDALSRLGSSLSDRYAIDRQIGAGGMATVYLARDLKHDRKVALKVLNPELGAVLGPERFLSEIKVTANLQHPNLLALFDSGEADGLLFYVMPYVEGESLRDRLDREKQLPLDDALRIATAVASALDYAHRHGVIHRDLKPENILLHDGQPLVADFGIALAVSNAGGNRITQTGLSLGTPQYMSPEQATGDRSIDGRTDIYSLGAVLYEMLTGDPPYTGSTAQAIIARVLTDKPRSMRTARDTIPPHVDAAVERALAKLPADRWATAHEFADALAHPLPTGATPYSIGNAATTTTPVRRALPWALAIVATCVAVSLGVLLAVRREPTRNVVRVPFNLDPAMHVTTAITGSSFAISPDGSRIAFIGTDARGAQQIFLRRINELEGRAIPGTADATTPTFSPDGKWIAFYARSQVQKVSVDGGAAIPLADLPTVQGMSWAPSGVIVAGAATRLVAIPANGGAPRTLTTPDTAAGETSHRWPLVLADGETVLYTSWRREGLSAARLAVASLKGGKPRVLDLSGSYALGVLDGTLVYVGVAGGVFAVTFDAARGAGGSTPVPVVPEVAVGPSGAAKAALSHSGSFVYIGRINDFELVLVDAHGAAHPVIVEPGGYNYPRFSPDGKRIAVGVLNGAGRDIWIYDTRATTLERLTTEGSLNTSPEWTPDGRRVAFISNRSGSSALWAQPADGSGPATRLMKREPVEEAALTHDGRFVVFRTGSNGGSADVWYAALNGDTTAKPISANPSFTESSPRASPDGRWVAYLSNESGVSQVYVRPFPGPGPRYQVSTGGGLAPVWSPDSKRIYYIANRQMIVADITTTPTFAVRSRQVLFDTDSPTSINHASFDVAPDGAHFLMLKPTQDARAV
jgi:Tol biopolymer transport system component